MQPSKDHKPFEPPPERARLAGLLPTECLRVLTNFSFFELGPDVISLPKRINTLKLTSVGLFKGLRQAFTFTRKGLRVELKLKYNKDQRLKDHFRNVEYVMSDLLKREDEDEICEAIGEQIVVLVLSKWASEEAVVELKRAKEWLGLEYAGGQQSVDDDDSDEL